jgi:hypothetical protein
MIDQTTNAPNDHPKCSPLDQTHIKQGTQMTAGPGWADADGEGDDAEGAPGGLLKTVDHLGWAGVLVGAGPKVRRGRPARQRGPKRHSNELQKSIGSSSI